MRAAAIALLAAALALPGPASAGRVILIGAGAAAPAGVAPEDHYAARLERALAERDPEAQVVNLGATGLGPLGTLLRLDRRGLPGGAQQLVWGYALRDLAGPHYRASATRPALAPLDGGWGRLRALRDWLRPPRGSMVWELDDNYFRNMSAWGSLGRALDRLAERARARGVCAGLLIQTRPERLDALHPYAPHYAAVARAARDRGLAAWESWPRFRGRDAAALRLPGEEPTLSAAGHALLFETLRDGLAAQPPRCG